VSEPVCGLPSSDAEAQAALEGVRTIAVVGLSPNPERPSHRVASYLKEQGFTIIPIRPGTARILDEPAFPSLTAYGRAVDMVDIFRRPEAVPEIVAEAIRLGCKVIWMQEGITHEPAGDAARAAGLRVVQNRCVLKVHRARTHG
jgi:uncharacterized protein